MLDHGIANAGSASWDLEWCRCTVDRHTSRSDRLLFRLAALRPSEGPQRSALVFILTQTDRQTDTHTHTHTHTHEPGSNLPGIASQFANQILGTANQLRNAEQKSANQKNHLRSGALGRCIALDSQQLVRSHSASRKLLVPPRRSPAPVLAELASSGLLLDKAQFPDLSAHSFRDSSTGRSTWWDRVFALEDFLEMAVNLSTVCGRRNSMF